MNNNRPLSQKLLNCLSQAKLKKFYSVLMGTNKINQENLWNIFNELPILNREEIVDNIDDFISTAFVESSNHYMSEYVCDMQSVTRNHDRIILGNNEKWVIEYTTGTTGKPFPILKSSKTRAIESKYLLKKRKAICSSININNGFLFLHSNIPKIFSMDLWKFNESDMETVLKIWEQENIKWIFATPQILSFYAKYIKKIKREIFDIGQLSFVEYTSQSITKEQTDIISEVFKTKLVNNYGCREFWNVAYACTNGNLHINDEYLYLEVVDENDKVIHEYNKPGYLVVTDLVNSDMPLIRYRLGDRVKIIQNNCQCGCQSNIIEFCEDNRRSCIYKTELDGGKVFRRVMRGIYFHDYIDDIKRIKIVQDEEFHFSIFLDKSYDNDKYFEQQFLNRTGSLLPDINNYKMSFIYNYPYENEDIRGKEIIFKLNIK